MTIERSQNMAGSVVSYDISTEVRYRVILELLVNYSLNEVFENMHIEIRKRLLNDDSNKIFNNRRYVDSNGVVRDEYDIPIHG